PGRYVPTPPVGAGEPPGSFPSLPGDNMTDPGPDRQEPFRNRSYADIVTQVDEGPTGRLMFGVGATSYGGLSGNLILHESNFDLFNIPRSFRDFTNGQAFRGAGQDFRLELSPGTLINRALISFRDPYLFDLPIGFGISGYTFQRVYPDWTEGRTGVRGSLGRQFGTRTYADVALRAEDVQFHGFNTPAPADFLAAAGHTALYTIRPSLRFDNRNDPFVATKGQYLEVAFEQGWGTFTYPKITAEGRIHIPTGRRPDGSGVRFLTLRGFYGATGRDTPVYERFYAGDFRSMRGFAYRGVGPHIFNVNVGGIQTAIGSFEYQFPWTANDRLQQVVFCDFGTVTPDYSFDNFRAAVGTGLRVLLPAFGPLPLAFDLAFPVAKAPGDRTRYFTFFIGAFW
ncbi:MAG: BamA/TamA family outer membrane protein, partial [Isosphaeraceae bacterium]|nr:BamA/TamA family outer membrane protein [Isosphaeraceae bacterium]